MNEKVNKEKGGKKEDGTRNTGGKLWYIIQSVI